MENNSFKWKTELYRSHINPFLANVPILYPTKTPENWGYKMGTLAGIVLTNKPKNFRNSLVIQTALTDFL